MTGPKYVYRVTVVADLENGRVRVLLVKGIEDLRVEHDGVLSARMFYPPGIGTSRDYLTNTGALARQKAWAENGIVSTITRSHPIEFP